MELNKLLCYFIPCDMIKWRSDNYPSTYLSLSLNQADQKHSKIHKQSFGLRTWKSWGGREQRKEEVTTNLEEEGQQILADALSSELWHVN